MKDLVSIVISNFNKEKYIRNSIKSVLNQSYKNIEIIIVDDGSTDRSNKIIEEMSFVDKRIKYFQKQHMGKIKAYNFGISQVKGKYIKIFSSDDVLIKDAISQLIEQINGYDVVAHNCNVVNEKLNILKKYLINIEQYSKKNITIYDVINGTGLPSGNYFMKENTINKIFPIPEDATYEDWYIFLKLIQEKFNIKYYNRPLVLYRQVPNSSYGGVFNSSYEIIKYRAKRKIKMLKVFQEILPNQYKLLINFKMKEYELLSEGNIFKIIRSNLKLDKKIKMILKIHLNFLYRILLFFRRKITINKSNR